MIDEKEEEILKKYQFWKIILKKNEHNNLEDENIEYCNSCEGCSAGASCRSCHGCSSCSEYSSFDSLYQKR